MDRCTISTLVGIPIGTLYRKYKSREIVKSILELPIILRLDGVKFGKLLRNFERPRDRRVHDVLIEAAIEILKFMGADIAYVVSDEINIIFVRNLPYGGRYFKLTSISASIASSTASIRLGLKLYFDSRVVKVYDINEIVEYLLYRARVGMNNYLSSLCYIDGIVGEYTPNIEELLIYVLWRHRDKLDNWKIFGSIIYKEKIVKKCIDKLSGREVQVYRKVLKICEFSIQELMKAIENIRDIS